MRVVVLGGGIAGLSLAHALAPHVRQLSLLEAEPQICAHSSGRNAAMFRPLESYAAACQLAQLSAVLLDQFFAEGRSGWLKTTGMALTAAHADALLPLATLGKQQGVRAAWRSGVELARAIPHAPGLAEMVGLFLPDGGVLDIHRITSHLAARARAHGAQIRLRSPVRRVLTQHARVTAVELADGQRLAADVVVLAAGAWSAQLAAGCGAELPLGNYRRHLVQLRLDAPPSACPILWHAEPEVYFRVEGTGVLASPCDRQRVAAGVPATDDEALCELARRLTPLGAVLGQARVQAAWACVRCLAPDGRAVLGPDPRLHGLFWLSALGGHGMTIGVGAGEWLSRLVLGEDLPNAAELAPARLIQPSLPQPATSERH